MVVEKQKVSRPKAYKKTRVSPKTVAVLVTFLTVFALMYVVLPEFGKFGNTYSLLKHARIVNLIWAAASMAATYLFAAVTYQLLALHRLAYARTLFMQVASSFANRILPAGAGGLALNVQYLRKSKHSTVEAGTVVAVNNALGFVANMLILSTFLIFRSDDFRVNVSPQAFNRLSLYVVIGISVTLIGLILARQFIDIGKFLRPLAKSFALYKQQPKMLLKALLSSVAVCLLYALILFCVAHSLNVRVTFVQAFLAMTLATIGSVLIPTPGGIGGAEGGIVSALVAIHIGAPQALAVALLYRVFTFWIPLLTGAVVFRFSLRYLK